MKQKNNDCEKNITWDSNTILSNRFANLINVVIIHTNTQTSK